MKTETKFPFPKDVSTTATASGWELLKAKLFGKRYEDFCCGITLIAYHYKGKIYITKYGRI